MMEQKQVKKLLGKFYSGGTSPQEEHLLRNYFLSGHVPEEFAADRIYFMSVTEERENNKPSLSLRHKLDKMIDERFDHADKRVLKPVITWAVSIAASLLIVTGAYFYLSRQRFRDTCQNPQEAYQETRKALLYVSKQLNRGAGEMSLLQYADMPEKELQKVKQATQPVNDLKYLNNLSRGMEGVKELQSFADAGQILGKYIHLENDHQ